MLVRMKSRIGGYRNGEEWPAIGDVFDVPAHEAADLISQGYAEEASDDRPIEATAAADGGETSVGDDGAGTAGDDGGTPAEDGGTSPLTRPAKARAKRVRKG